MTPNGRGTSPPVHEAGAGGPALAVVVVIHNSASELRRLLDSIDEHLHPVPQIIVVDNGSHDGGGELARARGAELITLAHNPGFGAGCNAGVARASAAVTALVNPDVQLLDGGLARLAQLARDQDRLLAPRLLNDDGTPQRSAHLRPGRAPRLLGALIPPALLPPRQRARVEPWRSERPVTVGWAIAACLVARTTTLRALGPFDERIFLFHEDLDLCLRARAAGVPTELHPEVVLGHSGGHATLPRYGSEPHEDMAMRRREVVGRVLGRRALALDDAAQSLTFATRALARILLRRDPRRELDQLKALLRARRRAPGPD
jgi:N-acetylglucosaminyl-diphospho-decaprenol L-rhamnosyltransferase